MRTLLIISFLSLTNAQLSAQQYWISDKLIWAEVTVALSGSDRFVGDIGINYAEENNLYTLQVQGITGVLFGHPNDNVTILNFCYGKIARWRFFHASVSGGFGFGVHNDFYITDPTTKNPPEKITNTVVTFAIPIEAKLNFKLGLTGTHMKIGASLNPRISVVYLGFGFDVGKLFE